MKKSIQDLKESLRKKEEKQQRLHEQEETVKKDIRVLRYLIIIGKTKCERYKKRNVKIRV
ncbi:hypothetical protein ACIXWX_22895 [Bacteroides fragilis]